MPEALANDFVTALVAELPAAAGAGTTFAVNPAAPATLVGMTLRCRVGLDADPGEILTATVTTAGTWTVVARAVEDAAQFPAITHAAGRPINAGVLTAGGLTALVAQQAAPIVHTHDDRYYTEAEVTSLLSGKANTAHTHVSADVTGLDAALAAKLDAVPASFTIRIDQALGNDSTGVRGDLAKPYQTFSGMLGVRQDGDRVVVGPGTYNVRNLTPATGTWRYHFENGAVVDYQGPDDGAIFDDSVTGANGPVSCTVSGEGVFRNATTSATDFGLSSPSPNSAVYITNAASDVVIQCREVVADRSSLAVFSNAAGVTQTGGKLTVIASGRIAGVGNGTYPRGLWWGGGVGLYLSPTISGFSGVYASVAGSAADTCHVLCHRVTAGVGTAANNGNLAVHTDGTNPNATLFVEAQEVYSAGGAAVHRSGGSNEPRLELRAMKVWSGTDRPLSISAGTVYRLDIGEMLVNTAANSALTNIHSDVAGNSSSPTNTSLIKIDRILDVNGNAPSATGFMIATGYVRIVVGHCRLRNTSPVGITLTDKTTLSGLIDGSAAASVVPVVLGSSGVTLADLVLLAAAGGNTVGAAEPLTATVQGLLTLNRPPHANVTFFGGPVARTDENRTLIDLLNPLAAAEVAVTGATAAAVGRMHVCSGTTVDYTLTLPAAAGNAGKLVGVKMASALTRIVTLAGNGAELIDGQNTRAMWSGESAILLCDGVGWSKIAGVTKPMACVMRRAAGLAVPISTVTAVPLDATDSDPSGRMADLAGGRIVVRRAGLYRILSTLFWDSIGPSNNVQTRVNKNGVLLTNVSISNYATSSISTQADAMVVLAAGDAITVDAYQTAGATNLGSDPKPTSLVEVPSW
jgi:hypothetical protein